MPIPSFYLTAGHIIGMCDRYTDFLIYYGFEIWMLHIQNVGFISSSILLHSHPGHSQYAIVAEGMWLGPIDLFDLAFLINNYI
jgi:hypothetical protein